MRPTSPSVVLQAPDANSLAWLSLTSPVEVLLASRLDEVAPILRRAEQVAAAGKIAAGFVSYEASPAFDPALVAHCADSLPLAWFGVFDDAQRLDSLPPGSGSLSPLAWQPSVSTLEYESAIDAIHRHIARGDTYQINYTLRLTTSFLDDPWDLFAALCRGQGSRCCAYVDTGDRVLCSASPELFFRLEGERIWSRPMKGTAPRGRTLEEDAERANWLQTSSKNRAENVMIVDMVRNDIGRVALPDSVYVSDLWKLEKYPSLYQLTSTVEARTRASLHEIFAALFPCASVTGAPKVRSMKIIRELEQDPRGAYTGAIGLIGPGRRARFNVGIRTVDIDTLGKRAIYGTGSGVVWDSVAREEWRECRTKARVLEPPPPDFELLETMLWEPDKGLVLLERHLQRLASSATYFDFALDLERVREDLAQTVSDLGPGTHRVRLLVCADGTSTIETTLLHPSSRPWRLAVATHSVASGDRFLFHKTTHRQIYEAHREQFPRHDDVLLWNERGEITESTLANVVIRHQQRWTTPPSSSGLLSGTLRAELLDKGEIEEGLLKLEDLDSADEICLVNSVRGWIATELDRSDLRRMTETRPLKRA